MRSVPVGHPTQWSWTRSTVPVPVEWVSIHSPCPSGTQGTECPSGTPYNMSSNIFGVIVAVQFKQYIILHFGLEILNITVKYFLNIDLGYPLLLFVIKLFKVRFPTK